MKAWRQIGLVVSLLSLLCLEVQAREVWTTRLGGWKIGAYSNDRTGEFNHCAAGISYHSGIFLFFAIGRDFGWSMNLANSSWQLQVGSRYPIRYQIDRGPILSGTAIVNDEKMVEIELLDSKALFQLLKAGRTLYVDAAGETFGFDLTNSSKALDAALRCTSTLVANESRSINPFARAESSNPFSSTASAPENVSSRSAVRVEAAALTANLLSAAKIDGFTIVESIPADLDFFDAMWLAPGVIGGVMVRPDETPDSALAGLAGRASANCKGRHASAKLPDKGGVTSLKLMCDETASTIVLIPRARGGVYIVTILPAPAEATSALPGAEPAPPPTEVIGGRLVDAGYNSVEGAQR